MEPPVRVAVVGCGWWATQVHLPALLSNPDCDVVALVDPDTDRRRAAAGFSGVNRGYPDVQALLAGGGVDAAIVATTSASHHAITRELLLAGVHVLVEKPLCLEADHAWELVRLAREGGLHLTVGYTYQHTASAAALQASIGRGDLGQLRAVVGLFSSMVEAFYRGQPHEYEAVVGWPVTGPAPTTYSAAGGGGQLYTQVTHPLGMMHFVTGLQAQRVCAFTSNGGLAVDLFDAVAIEFDADVVGTLSSIGNVRPGEPQQHELRYYGSHGLALQDLGTGRVEIWRDGSLVSRVDAGDHPYPADGPANDLIQRVRGQAAGDPGWAPAAAWTVATIEAAHRSARAGRVSDVAQGAQDTVW